MNSKFVSLTREMIDNGIYIDVEMQMKDEIPALCGEFSHRRYRCTVFDRRLQLAAREKKLRVRNPEGYMVDLLDRSVASGNRIIGFSKHDYKMMVSFLPDSRQAEFERQYFDANKVVKKFFMEYRSQEFARLKQKAKEEYRPVGLKDYLKNAEVDYPYPSCLEMFKGPADALNKMRQQLGKKERFVDVSPGAKEAWSNLITYNEHDCKGMRHLLSFVLTNLPGKRLGNEAVDSCRTKVPDDWYGLAKWLKKKKLMSPKARSQCYTMGRYLTNRKPPSLALSKACMKIWEKAVGDHHWKPGTGKPVLANIPEKKSGGEVMDFCRSKAPDDWFGLAKWLKKKKLMSPKARSQCHIMGTTLSKGQEPSLHLSMPCMAIWEKAVTEHYWKPVARVGLPKNTQRKPSVEDVNVVQAELSTKTPARDIGSVINAINGKSKGYRDEILGYLAPLIDKHSAQPAVKELCELEEKILSRVKRTCKMRPVEKLFVKMGINLRYWCGDNETLVTPTTYSDLMVANEKLNNAYRSGEIAKHGNFHRDKMEFGEARTKSERNKINEDYERQKSLKQGEREP